MYVELDRAYRKQRELDRLKDDFIATASHELRTPLTGVQGFLELLFDAVEKRDFLLIQTLTLLAGATVVLASLAADIVQAFLDPRVRLAGR